MTQTTKIGWKEYEQMVFQLSREIRRSKIEFDGIYGVPRGGLVLAVCLSHKLDLPLKFKPTVNTLISEDISDFGKTLLKYRRHKIVCLYSSKWTMVKPTWFIGMKRNKDDWIRFPWENE